MSLSSFIDGIFSTIDDSGSIDGFSSLQISFKIFSEDDEIQDEVAWDVKSYKTRYLNLNQEKSNNNEIVLNVINDIPDNDSIIVSGLKIKSINQNLENEPKIFIQISNNSPVHEKLNVVEDNHIEFMKASLVYVDFEFPDRMYANDYLPDYKDFKNDTINIILKNYNPRDNKKPGLI